MPATLIEAAKPLQSETVAPKRATIIPPPLEPFAWEEHALSGDTFGFRVWLIGFSTMACLALLDWLAALLG